MNAIPAGYKQTEVGVIPEDWAPIQLRKLSPSQSVGLVINPSTYVVEDGTVPMLVGSNISANNISWEGARLISAASNQSLPASRLNVGDLVTVRVGEPGITAVVPQELDGCNCASVMIVRKHSSFDSRWLCHVMNSRQGLVQVENVQYGTAQKQFNISDAINFTYATPPLPEQRAIAAALSDADALLAKLDQFIAKKRDLKQAAMQQLLTGQTRLPGFCGEWEVKRFGDIATPRKDRLDPRNGGVQTFCIELEHIEQGSGRLAGSGSTGEGSSLKTTFRPGDVLFGKLRAYLRKFWLADRSGVCSTEIWALVANQKLLLSAFLFQLVTADRFIEVASAAHGTHMPRSDWNVVKSYEVALPQLGEQTAIAAVLSDMDAEIAALEARRDKTHELKQGMMQQLLTGRIRLV